VHLTQRRRAIRKELEPQLTVRNVERGIRKRHLRRAGLLPRYQRARGWFVSPAGGSDGEHTGVQVETDHIPGAANLLRDESGYYTGAARNIQDALARSRLG
jgi:hypothetical protein